MSATGGRNLAIAVGTTAIVFVVYAYACGEYIHHNDTSDWRVRDFPKFGMRADVPTSLGYLEDHPTGAVVELHEHRGTGSWDRVFLITIAFQKRSPRDFAVYTKMNRLSDRTGALIQDAGPPYTRYRFNTPCPSGEILEAAATFNQDQNTFGSDYLSDDDRTVRRLLQSVKCTR